jgi:hypothetical protein
MTTDDTDRKPEQEVPRINADERGSEQDLPLMNADRTDQDGLGKMLPEPVGREVYAIDVNGTARGGCATSAWLTTGARLEVYAN